MKTVVSFCVLNQKDSGRHAPIKLLEPFGCLSMLIIVVTSEHHFLPIAESTHKKILELFLSPLFGG